MRKKIVVLKNEMCINNGFQKTFQNVCVFPLFILQKYTKQF